MRRLHLALAVAVLAVTAAHAGIDPAAVPNPFLADNELVRGQLTADRAMIDILLLKGDTAKAAKMIESSWGMLTTELAARHRQFADLSLAAVNPWTDESARSAASAKMESLRPKFEELTELLIPAAAARAELLQRAGQDEASQAASYSKTYAAIKLVLERTALEGLPDPQGKERRLLATLMHRSGAIAGSDLDPLIAKARALPAPPGAVASLCKIALDETGFLPLVAAIRDHLSIDRVYSALLQADPLQSGLWITRARVRLSAGRFNEAVADFNVARRIEPDHPSLAALGQQIRDVPLIAGSIWQEPFFNTDAMALAADRIAASKAGNAFTRLDDRLERAAGAASRNRHRHLFACSFIADGAARAPAIQWTVAQHRAETALVPFPDPALTAEFSAAIQKAGTDGRAVLAAHNEYAPIFAGIDGFWKHRIETLGALGQVAGALGALEVAAAVAPEAAWIADYRARLTAK